MTWWLLGFVSAALVAAIAWFIVDGANNGGGE
jgi:hypothetical protein